MSNMGSANWSETASNNNVASPNGWTSGTMLPSQVEPVGREMMSALKMWWNRANGVKTSGGSANVQTLTYDVAEASYYTGQLFFFKAGFTNSGATTLNVSSLGAKAVQRGGAALVGNEIIAGVYYGVIYDGTQFQLITFAEATPASVQQNPANPAGTAATAAAVMMGLGSSLTITPTATGRVVFCIEGLVSNTTTGDGALVGARRGTGAAPANAAALTGTALAQPKSVFIETAPAAGVPFTTGGIVTGLAIGTAVWFDIALAAITGGTASVSSLSGYAYEI